MIDIKKVRFAYGDKVSIAWMPVGMGVKVAITARSEKDRHDKHSAKANLMNRLEYSEDARFVFYVTESNARRVRNLNPNLLKFQTILNACLHAHNRFNMPYARKFVHEVSKPSQKFVNPPWFDVAQKKQIEQVVPHKGTPINPLGPYVREGLKVYFMHDVENRYSLGWTYNPADDTVWFAVASCHEKDAFSRDAARETILNRRGLKFKIRNDRADGRIGYNDFLNLISTLVNQWNRGYVVHPDATNALGTVPDRVIDRILDLPASIVRRQSKNDDFGCWGTQA